MKKILHPTDFSENAAKALVFAFQIAKKTNAELVLLHVGDLPTIMNSPSDMPSFTAMEEAHVTDIVERLKKYATVHLGTMNPDFNIDYQAVLHRSRTKGIIEYARETAADLLVIGMKGESRITEMLLGSTAKKLVQNAPCPILMVPPHAEYESISKVLYASDYEMDDQRVLKNLADTGITKGADVTMLHVIAKENKVESEVSGLKKKIAARLKNNTPHFVDQVGEDIYETIMQYIHDRKPDMLVMLEREHDSMVEKLFHKDLVKRFATHSTVPVLSYNQHLLHTESNIH
ncbi:MAG: universal stress protein [Chitinophagaceae bacterium]